MTVTITTTKACRYSTTSYETALDSAARHGFTAIVKLLLENGAEIEPETNMLSPLHNAIYHGYLGDKSKKAKSLEVVKLLLEHGADIAVLSRHGLPPFGQALSYSSMEVAVETFLKSAGLDRSILGVKPSIEQLKAIRETWGRAKIDDEKASEFLYNVMDKWDEYDEETVLFLAEVIITCGLPALRNNQHDAVFTALTKKASALRLLKTLNVEMDFYKFILKRGDRTPLQYAIEEYEDDEREEKIKILIEANVNVHTKVDGKTAFDYAIEQGTKAQRLYKILLHSTEVINQQDEKGNTRLHTEIENGRESFITILLNKGANIDVVNADGDTPLHVAIKAGNEKVITKLFDRTKTDPSLLNIANNDGDTPLHLALKHGQLKLAAELVKIFEVALDTPNADGNTPLHLAIMYEHTEFAKALFIKLGHNRIATKSLKTANNDKNSPLHLAAIKQDFDLLRLIVGNFRAFPALDRNARNKQGNTFLDILDDLHSAHKDQEKCESSIIKELIKEAERFGVKRSRELPIVEHIEEHRDESSETPTTTANPYKEAIKKEINKLRERGTKRFLKFLNFGFGNLRKASKIEKALNEAEKNESKTPLSKNKKLINALKHQRIGIKRLGFFSWNTSSWKAVRKTHDTSATSPTPSAK